MGKSLKDSTEVCNHAAAFTSCISKVQNEIQDGLKLLYGEFGKGKSSNKAESALNEIKDLTALQQNINYVLGMSLQQMADTLFIQEANVSILYRNCYLEEHQT